MVVEILSLKYWGHVMSSVKHKQTILKELSTYQCLGILEQSIITINNKYSYINSTQNKEEKPDKRQQTTLFCQDQHQGKARLQLKTKTLILTKTKTFSLQGSSRPRLCLRRRHHCYI